MRVLVLLNSFTIGGTEKAAAHWATGLASRGHEVMAVANIEGPRRAAFEAGGVTTRVLGEGADGSVVRDAINFSPDVLHQHSLAYDLDETGRSITSRLPRCPILQTNVFGGIDRRDTAPRMRAFVSWTSAVQAARRSGIPLDEQFFRAASVTVYPVIPPVTPTEAEVCAFRAQIGVRPGEIVVGRLGRPVAIKWSHLILPAFNRARRRDPRLRLLLRSAPDFAVKEIFAGEDAAAITVLPPTSDERELATTVAAFDLVMHVSGIGESFGYALAEPMAQGKPAITNSTPWADQAQLELVADGCGRLASTVKSLATAMLEIADEPTRRRTGSAAQRHIAALCDFKISLDRLESLLEATIENRQNPFAEHDLERAEQAARRLDAHEFGETGQEWLALRAQLAKRTMHDNIGRLLRSRRAVR